MELILLRHGQTPANVAGALDTAEPGLPLNETGLAQAADLPNKWLALGLPIPKRIITSTLQRTQQTVANLADSFALPISIFSGCREIQAGDLEMSNSPEHVEIYMRTIGAWMMGRLDQRMPGGETGAEVLERFDKVVVEAFSGLKANDTVVVTAHGAVIRYWCALRANNIPFPLAATVPVQNAATVRLRLPEEELDNTATLSRWAKDGLISALTWSDREVSSWEYPEDITTLMTSKSAWLEQEFGE